MTWRLNNSSVASQDDDSKDATQQKKLQSLFTQQTKAAELAKTKVRPGINKILPKEIIRELVEDQGRLKMEFWL